MHVHLALPGLLWPARALPDLTFDLDLPALHWLLGRGRCVRSTPLAFEHWLAGRFGHDTTSPPAAALRFLGDGFAPGDAHWIGADPAHLAFEHGQPTLSDPADLALTPEEIAELETAVKPALAAIGDFSLHTDGHGYIKLAAPTTLDAAPLSAAIGRGAAELLPRGSDAVRWLHLANEAQMALHDLPVNSRREAAGRPTVNTLWFWGAGSLPKTQPIAYKKVGGGGALAKGCACHAGVDWHSSAAVTCDVPVLLIEERLVAPTQQLDAHAWREALLAINHEQVVPLLAALRSGQVKRLTLTALGDEASIDVNLGRSDVLRFWRRPLTLTDLLQ
jgi:hypothetical protein